MTINRSREEGEMRTALIQWGRVRWPGARVMEELDTGGCRVDLAFVQPDHLAVIEIKSSRDTLIRLERQIEHFLWGAPEVWLAYAPKWIEPIWARNEHGHTCVPYEVGHLVVADGAVIETITHPRGWSMPHEATPNELLITPLLHLVHLIELKNIAALHSLPFRERWTRKQMMRLLAHKLTGDQIKAGVCRELRARPRGWAGDEPIEAEAA